MAKKNTPIADEVMDVVAVGKSGSADGFDAGNSKLTSAGYFDEATEITSGMRGLADYLGVNLDADINAHKLLCNKDMEAGYEATLRVGLRLIAIKQACGHGEFQGICEQLGLSVGSRRRAMILAVNMSEAGDKKRIETLMSLGQTKALDFLALPPAAQDRIADDPELLRESIEASSREFKKKIKALEEQRDRLVKQVETNEQHALARQKSLAPSIIPPQVQDVRREVAALYEKAHLSIQGLTDLAQPLVDASQVEGGAEWLMPCVDQVRVAMLSLLAQLGVQADSWAKHFALEAYSGLPDAASLAYFQPDEIEVVKNHFAGLLETHADEAKKRQNRALNARSLGRKRNNV